MEDLTKTEVERLEKEANFPIHPMITDHLDWAIKFMQKYEKKHKTNG